jgi:hypothetical protein
MKTQPKHSLSFEPVLLVLPTTGECPRCKGSTKIPNLEPGYHLRDCPDCEGKGRVEVLAPMTESDLDESVALGMELSQLRRAKQTALDAARVLRENYRQMIAALSPWQDAALLDEARALAGEGLAQVSELVAFLEVGGAR